MVDIGPEVLAVVRQFGLPWPEVDENAYRSMAVSLREFASDVLDDGWIANQHVQRLLSSGYGEAFDALDEHWGRVKDQHIQAMATAAGVFSTGLDEAATGIEALKVTIVNAAAQLAAEYSAATLEAPLTNGASYGPVVGHAEQLRAMLEGRTQQTLQRVVQHLSQVVADPAVDALENLAADLAKGVGAQDLGLRYGVDVAGSATMSLASAGPTPPTAPGRGKGGKGLHVDHDEHHRAGGRLGVVAAQVHGRTGGKLAAARQHHAGTRGSDAIASSLDPLLDTVLERLGNATSALGDHLGGALPGAVVAISADQLGTDGDIRARLARMDRQDPPTPV